MYKEGNVWKYFGITIFWSWGMLLVPVVDGLSMDLPLTRILFALGGISPSLAAIITVLRGGNGTYHDDFFKRITDFSRIKISWYLIIFLLVPVTAFLAMAINSLLGGPTEDLSTLRTYISEPASLLVFMIFTLIFGPLAEEIGWRGYATDQMKENYHWITACLVIGFFWALWHVPLYFIEGSYQWQLAQGPVSGLILYNIEKFSTSIIMFWIYKNTHRSILAGILYHFSINFTGELLDLSSGPACIQICIQILIAVLIIARNNKRFSRKPKPIPGI